jgi:hypothetical protein
MSIEYEYEDVLHDGLEVLGILCDTRRDQYGKA